MIYDLIIIGGGPAGMTAGIYASRLNLKTLLITKDFGGQMTSKAVEIENYPGFPIIQAADLIKKMKEHLKTLPLEIQLNEVVGVKREGIYFNVSTKKKGYKACAVVLATGSTYRHLNVPGEKEFLGKGVSHCSVCDGPVFKNKTVAVIGGGNAGFETAAFLINIAEKIYILEASEQTKAFGHVQEIVSNSDKIEIITQARIKEIRGEQMISSIVFDHEGKEKILDVQGVFIEVGYVPAVPDVNGLVDFNEEGEVKVEYETMQTKTPGLYAAGDVNAGQFKQIVAAAGEGAKAVLASYGYIKHKKIEK
jgi:thioredoxin-disulfide reductase